MFLNFKKVIAFVVKPKGGVAVYMYFKTSIFTFKNVNFILGKYSMVKL